MRIAVLGPLEVVGHDGRCVALTPRKAREVLAVLALEHPNPVSIDGLVDALWDAPPPAAVKTVQAHLSRVRRALCEAGARSPGVAGGGAGYRLVDEVELDTSAVYELARSARRKLDATGWGLAADHLAMARAMLRGAPELPATASCARLRTRVDDLRCDLGAWHVTALIVGGDLSVALAELEPLLADFPLREQLWVLRMGALARAGRFAEALRAYAEVRSILGDELGIEPGDELRQAEIEVLAGRVPAFPAARRPAASPPTAAPRSASQQRPPTRFAEVDGAHIAYCTVGEGPADIVLLNPGTLPSDCVLTEPRFAAAIATLTGTARVTWFDRRGIGLSERCTADRLPTLTDWVRDLMAVLAAVGAEHPILLATEDTVPVAVRAAVDQPERISGLVLVNAYPRFTRSADYPFGFDPGLADDSDADITASEPPHDGFDLLSVIAPSVAADPKFRTWWDDAGRRGASPNVARALRNRHTRIDIRPLLPKLAVPVLHAVNPGAVAHDRGHDRHLAANIRDIDTVELSGPDELWWLDATGEFIANLERFVHRCTPTQR